MNALTACPNDARRDLNVARVRRQLLQDPFTALELLPGVACPSERRKLAILIAQIWARQDINAAWNAVSRSPLSTAEKQLMFNEVWG